MDTQIAVFTNLSAVEEGVDANELLQAQGAIFRRLTDHTLQRAIINLDGTHLHQIHLNQGNLLMSTYMPISPFKGTMQCCLYGTHM